MKISYCLIGPRKEVLQFFDGYLTLAFETNYRETKGEGMKTASKVKAIKRRGIKNYLQNSCCRDKCCQYCFHKYNLGAPLRIC